MNKLLKNQLEKIQSIAYTMYINNWAEANAGNISVNITDICKYKKNKIKKIKFHNPYINTYEKIFLITQSGKRMRDIAIEPEKHTVIIKMYKKYYEILENSNYLPSSELISHLAVHDYLIKENREEKVIIHSHPTDIIVLSHNKQYANSEKITKLLNEMHTEVETLLPKGIGFVKEYAPGSKMLAKETLKSIKKHDICIWQKHGCISIGSDINNAFDKIEIINKAASIFLKLSN